MKEREPIQITRLRELARNDPTPEVLELLWEVRRLQLNMRDYLKFVEFVRKAWQEDVGGTLAGIESKRFELLKEPCTSEIYWNRKS
jgi:hypothetical protein